jgi:hypothetical protein
MGIYADLAAKRAKVYDKELEGRVRTWIESVVDRTLGDQFRESLMDGAVVCELFNKLKPGTISKIHRSPILMFRRENWGFFQRACIAIGCKEDETCVFEDVYDDKNMGLFLANIVALARQTQYEPDYNGPKLQDATKNSGPGQVSHAEAKYIPSKAEEAALIAHEAKVQARHTEHGILMNPNDPGVKPSEQYIETAADEAVAKAEAARTASRYIEHGIVMNPAENPANSK